MRLKYQGKVLSRHFSKNSIIVLKKKCRFWSWNLFLSNLSCKFFLQNLQLHISYCNWVVHLTLELQFGPRYLYRCSPCPQPRRGRRPARPPSQPTSAHQE
jgi:hypothetical protein